HHHGEHKHNAADYQRHGHRDVAISNPHVRMHTLQGRDNHRPKNGEQENHREAQKSPDKCHRTHACKNGVPAGSMSNACGGHDVRNHSTGSITREVAPTRVFAEPYGFIPMSYFAKEKAVVTAVTPAIFSTAKI